MDRENSELNNDASFQERPQENDRSKATKYIQGLLEKEILNKNENRQDEIDSLKEVLKLLNQKKYGLVWEEHAEKVEEKMKKEIPIFKEIKTKKLTNDSLTNDYNFLLEGDNLHSLYLLEKTHTEKIDLIYIDPPYNTGSKDFKYNDSFVDKNDSFIHSKWISFMERRLKKAVKLLKKDGVLLVSIDDHEYAQLKMLLDEILPTGYVTTIHVEMSATQGMKVRSAKLGNIVKNGEAILVYTRDGHKNVVKNLLYDIRPYDTHYSKILTENNEIRPLKEEFKKKYPNEMITSLDSMFENNKNFHTFVENNVDKICADDKVTGFNISDYTVNKVYHVKRGNRKYYLINNGKKLRQLLMLKDSWGITDSFGAPIGMRKIRGDWWKEFYKDMGNVSKEGGVKLINGKKPLRLIKQLVKMTTNQNAKILDFFAGTGTTGQAVLDLNKEDVNSNRKFILATNHEVVASTYKRMTNIAVENNLNLKYFKTDFVSKQTFDLESDLLNNVKTLVELENGVDLTRSKYAVVFTRKEMNKLDLKGISKVYMRGRVRRMMSIEQQENYSNSHVEIVDIPESYFGRELKGWI